MTVMTWKYFETRQALWKFFMYSLKLSRNDKPRFVHSFFLGSVVLLLNAHDAGDTHAAKKTTLVICICCFSHTPLVLLNLE